MAFDAEPRLHVISPLSWVGETFKKLCSTSGCGFVCIADNGLAPSTDIGERDAVWIAPELLVALNDWRTRHNFNPLMLEAPRTDWFSSLPNKLLGRKMETFTVKQIRLWERYPEGFGTSPWSQPTQGRIPGFRAARRTLNSLKQGLLGAPANASIVIHGHLPNIREEWCVLVHGGKVEAACGYCVHDSIEHSSNENHDIRTVFDGAHFHDQYRAQACEAADHTAKAAHLGNASVIIAFQETAAATATRKTATPQPIRPIVIEVNPVWCTAPYPFEAVTRSEMPRTARLDHGAELFLEAIAESRSAIKDDGRTGMMSARSRSTTIYQPDSWMSAVYSRRYLGFL